MDYFNNLFGQPELTRRENWDGREEPVIGRILTDGAELSLEEAHALAAMFPGTIDSSALPDNTIDIDHEVVD